MSNSRLARHCFGVIDAVNELEFGATDEERQENLDMGETFPECTREERHWAMEARTLAEECARLTGYRRMGQSSTGPVL